MKMIKKTAVIVLALFNSVQVPCFAQDLLFESLQDSLVQSEIFPMELEVVEPFEPSDGPHGSGSTMDQAMIEFLLSLAGTINQNGSAIPEQASAPRAAKESFLGEILGMSHSEWYELSYNIAEIQVSLSDAQGIDQDIFRSERRIDVRLEGKEKVSYVSQFKTGEIDCSVGRQNRELSNEYVTSYSVWIPEENTCYVDSFYWKNESKTGSDLWLELVKYLHENGFTVFHEYRNYHYIWVQ